MILPIVGYGHPILRTVAVEIDAEYPMLEKLIADMWDTMYTSNGVGLAAPQINRAIRLFVIDSTQIFEGMEEEEKKKYPKDFGYKQVFINTKIIKLFGEEWSYNEGCLSIPKVREDVLRNEEVEIEYYDQQFNKQIQVFNGITARVILHEYDHIEGKLFIDKLPLLKKKLIKSKLTDITKGKVKVDYKMTFSK